MHHLCLAAAGDTNIGGLITSGAHKGLLEGTAEAALGLTDSRDLLVLHLDESAGGPLAAFWHWFLVGRKVERNKEEEVRGQNCNTGEGCEFLAGTMASVGHPLEVSAREVGVGCEVYEAYGNEVLVDSLIHCPRIEDIPRSSTN